MFDTDYSVTGLVPMFDTDYSVTGLVPMFDTDYGVTGLVPMFDTDYSVTELVPMFDTDYSVTGLVPMFDTDYGVTGLVPMFDTDYSVTGLVPMFDTDYSVTGLVPMFDTDYSVTGLVPMFDMDYVVTGLVPMFDTDYGTPVLLQECMPKSEYFERDVSRMYLNCPPLYHYPPLFAPPAVNPPRFRGSPCSAGIPIRSFRQYQPLSIQDAGTDFRPNYYPTVPQFIPPGLVPGIHYLPPPLPMSVSMMAEPSRDMLGHMTAENQCMRPVLDKSQNKEPCA
ncbi:doublesex- and mab-3-related transcription factor B1 [Pelobates fuscus]|uniref:doublesex- and mab-3-related transcription factor B1 n=1 Tax=Pelobates fuscus TaxID=191477 RepID=UPI002FE43D72